MAAFIQTYKLDPNAISTIGSAELRGLTSVTIEGGGDEVSISTHGRPWVFAQFVDNLAWTITIESHTHLTGIKPGDVITSMALNGRERDQGATTGTDAFVISFANGCGGVVTSVSHEINHAGASTFKLTMKTFSNDGLTNPIVIS